MTDQDKASLVLRRAQTLFLALPEAGFTKATFSELGNAGALGVPFSGLSSNLKVVLFKLVRDYHDRLVQFALADEIGVSAATAAPPREDEKPIEPLDPAEVAKQVQQIEEDDKPDDAEDDPEEDDGPPVQVKATTTTTGENDFVPALQPPEEGAPA